MTEPADILIVDDDARLRHALERALKLEGFAVRTADDGPSAVRAIAAAVPSIVLLDVTMPGADGITVLRHLRSQGVEIPICILSARNEVEDRVRGLETGADDYLIKPFAISELRARIQALLRRGGARPAGTAIVGDLRVDPAARRAWRGERELELTRREFDLLHTLALRAGEVLDRERLLELVWGYEQAPEETNVVDVFVGYLRRKLEAGGEPRVLHTARGVGFTIDPLR